MFLRFEVGHYLFCEQLNLLNFEQNACAHKKPNENGSGYNAHGQGTGNGGRIEEMAQRTGQVKEQPPNTHA